MKYISVNSPDLSSYLLQIDTSQPIALDLEWENELSLFQFCSHFVLIIHHPIGKGNLILSKFLSSHKFFAKGIRNDKKMLKQKFGQDFSENIEDIAETRLIPYGHSQNFIQMTLEVIGAWVKSMMLSLIISKEPIEISLNFGK
jgi:hypothetical protein